MKRHGKKKQQPRKLELGKERVRELTQKDHEQIAGGNVVPQPMSDTNNTGICITTS